MDLSWQQMQTAATALGLPNNIFTVVNNKVMIDVSLLVPGATSLSATGVVEALFDLREVASKAQETFNTGKQIGERLAAFPQSTSGTAVNNVVLQAGLIYVRRPLSNSGILGALN